MVRLCDRAVALVYISILFPFYFQEVITPFIFSPGGLLRFASILLLIDRANGGSWFLRLGLPLTVAFSVSVIALALLFTETRFSLLVKAGAVLITTGLFIVCIEIIIRRYVYESLRIVWSSYALIPCLVLGAAALVLEHRKT
jgi:hypothetical protein